MAKTLGFISQVRRTRIDLRSTSPFFFAPLFLFLSLTSLSFALATSSQQTTDPRLMEAAKMYEQYFLSQMVRAMRGTVSKSGLVQESMGESIYQEQLDSQYVEAWSDRGGVGLAQMIHDHVASRQAQLGQLRDHQRQQMQARKAARAQGKSL